MAKPEVNSPAIDTPAAEPSTISTIEGGTVQVLAGSGTYSPATAYTIITGESVTGAFDDVTSDLAFLSPILAYGADEVTLSLYRNDVDFADVANTANTRVFRVALPGARMKLVDEGYGESRLKGIEDAIEKEVEDAVKFAEESPEPDPSLLESTTYDGPFAA